MNLEHWWNDDDRGKTELIGVKPVPVSLLNTNPWDQTWASGVTGCDCMSHSTAGDFQVLQAVIAHLMDEASIFRRVARRDLNSESTSGEKGHDPSIEIQMYTVIYKDYSLTMHMLSEEISSTC